jgi:hypothetical protein
VHGIVKERGRGSPRGGPDPEGIVTVDRTLGEQRIRALRDQWLAQRFPNTTGVFTPEQVRSFEAALERAELYRRKAEHPDITEVGRLLARHRHALEVKYLDQLADTMAAPVTDRSHYHTIEPLNDRRTP